MSCPFRLRNRSMQAEWYICIKDDHTLLYLTVGKMILIIVCTCVFFGNFSFKKKTNALSHH